MARSRFREDLYFRLNVLSIQLPPLRQRLEDVPLLVSHLLEKYGIQLERPGVQCPPQVLKVLMDYGWPGNIRELENCIQRMLLLCDGDLLQATDLPEQLMEKRGSAKAGFIMAGTDAYSIKSASEKMEKEMIRRALEKTGGNRTHAARLLEISHRSLLYKLKEYEIDQ